MSRSIVDKHVVPALGAGSDSVLDTTVSAFASALLKQRLGPKTDRNVHAETRLRCVRGRRIIDVPRVSTRGSGPGCLPDGRGTGFCALRPKFDHVEKNRLDQLSPGRAGADGPGDPVGDRQQRFLPATAVLPHQWRFGLADATDREVVLVVVLSALQDEVRNSDGLQPLHDLSQAELTRTELCDAVIAMAHHDERRDRVTRKLGKDLATASERLVVEVHPSTAEDEAVDVQTH